MRLENLRHSLTNALRYRIRMLLRFPAFYDLKSCYGPRRHYWACIEGALVSYRGTPSLEGASRIEASLCLPGHLRAPRQAPSQENLRKST